MKAKVIFPLMVFATFSLVGEFACAAATPPIIMAPQPEFRLWQDWHGGSFTARLVRISQDFKTLDLVSQRTGRTLHAVWHKLSSQDQQRLQEDFRRRQEDGYALVDGWWGKEVDYLADGTGGQHGLFGVHFGESPLAERFSPVGERDYDLARIYSFKPNYTLPGSFEYRAIAPTNATGITEISAERIFATTNETMTCFQEIKAHLSGLYGIRPRTDKHPSAIDPRLLDLAVFRFPEHADLWLCAFQRDNEALLLLSCSSPQK